ncbi:MAG TPA: hypothetical protein VM345_16170 [Acidimicrobiales bacterium]|nr:hypothetical protein [Acidimicrobiales bacterium]
MTARQPESRDRDLLVDVFDSLLPKVSDHPRAAAHRLHGEPHQGNRLVTPAGVVWVDLESCCAGPREWDFAIFDSTATDDRPDVDRALLHDLRVLNAARFATWQTRLMDRFPDLRELADVHLAFVRTTWAIPRSDR